MAVDPTAGKPMIDQGDGNVPPKHNPNIPGTENSGNSMMADTSSTPDLTLAKANAMCSGNDMMQDMSGPH